jgi:hypothetical protein
VGQCKPAVESMPQDSTPSASCSSKQNSLSSAKFFLIYHNYSLHTTSPIFNIVSSENNPKRTRHIPHGFLVDACQMSHGLQNGSCLHKSLRCLGNVCVKLFCHLSMKQIFYMIDHLLLYRCPVSDVSNGTYIV